MPANVEHLRCDHRPIEGQRSIRCPPPTSPAPKQVIVKHCGRPTFSRVVLACLAMLVVIGQTAAD
eukprot:1526588-Pyramimonas_sp.AAC.1